jgi:hypothetical protein
MGFLALIPPAALWVIALVALGLFVFGLLIANHPDIVAKGQDPAGCMMVLMTGLCVALGIFTAGAAFLGGETYSGWTRLVAGAPLLVVALIAAGAWISVQIARARRRREDEREQLAIPLYVLVHKDERELSAQYNALRTVDATTEMVLRNNPLALRWQLHEHLPRTRVLSMQAWTDPRQGEEDLSNTSLLLAKDLATIKATCPILLYADNDEQLDQFEKILSPSWKIHRLKIIGDQWLMEQWLPAVSALLPPIAARSTSAADPAPPDSASR